MLKRSLGAILVATTAACSGGMHPPTEQFDKVGKASTGTSTDKATTAVAAPLSAEPAEHEEVLVSFRSTFEPASTAP